MKIFRYLLIILLGINNFVLAADMYPETSDNSNYEKDYFEVMKLINNEKYELAIKKLNLLLIIESINYTKADIYNYLGYSHRKIENYTKSEDYYLKALKINPKHVGALEYIGELFIETNRIEKAKEYLKKLKEAAGTGSDEYKELSELVNNYL